MEFVPSECRSEPVPCHHIRLNGAHETLDSLYRTGTQDEMEEALGSWLTATIKRLEGEASRNGDCPKALRHRQRS